MVEAPTPNPPKNLKAAKRYGSLTTAEPIADTRKKIPMKTKVFLRPNRLVGQAPKRAPMTVPQSAEDITTMP